MLRPTLVTGGIVLVCWGVALLVSERIVLTERATQLVNKASEDRPEGFRGLFSPSSLIKQHTFTPPEWLPFALISGGLVMSFYAVVIPRKTITMQL